MLIVIGSGWESLVHLSRHEEFLFNKKTVGLWTKVPYWKEGFCFQKIVLDREYFFVFREFRAPFFFSKKRVYKKLKEEFSFVKNEDIIRNIEELEKFNEKPKGYLSYPVQGSLPEGKKGVEFKTKKGSSFHLLLNEGKPLNKESFLSLLAPLPALPCLLKF